MHAHQPGRGQLLLVSFARVACHAHLLLHTLVHENLAVLNAVMRAVQLPGLRAAARLYTISSHPRKLLARCVHRCNNHTH